MKNATAIRPRASRRSVILLAALFLLPLMIAALMLPFQEQLRSAATLHNGFLIDPQRDLSALELRLHGGGEETNREIFKGRWTLFTLASGGCSASCLERLDKMRRIRWMTGDDMRGVQRLLIFAEGGVAPDRFDDPGTLAAAPSARGRAALAPLLEDAGDVDAEWRRRIYLADPLGFVMMSYADDADPRGIVKDLRRLLAAAR